MVSSILPEQFRWPEPSEQLSTRTKTLSRDDAWRQEEQQFLRRHVDRSSLEEVADQRQVADKRYLLNVDGLLGNDDSADDHGAAVRDEYFGFRGLRIERGNTLHAGDTGIDLRVFNEHVHENGAVGGDLRRHFELQHRVDKLYGNGVIDGGLDGNLGSLLNRSLFVVLRDDAGL